jgi:hypothetical protein
MLSIRMLQLALLTQKLAVNSAHLIDIFAMCLAYGIGHLLVLLRFHLINY